MNSGTPTTFDHSNAPVPGGQLLGVGQLFDRAWGSIKNNLALVLGLSLVGALAAVALNFIPVVGGFFSTIIVVGYLACLLRLRLGQAFGFADFFWSFTNMNRFLNTMLATFLAGFAILIGTIFLLLPGIWIYTALAFSNIFLVRNDTDGITALRQSYDLVKGYWWYTFGIVLFISLLNILGALCFMVGLLVSMPLSMLILVEAADDLIRVKGWTQAQLGSGSGGPNAPTQNVPSTFAVNPQN